LSKDQEKGREVEDIGAITAIPSEKDELMSEMVLSLQNASIQQTVINNVVNDLRGSMTVTGEVADIQTLSPSGDQIVRIVNLARILFNFRFPEPNKPANILSEFQRAQNSNLWVRVKYNPAGKENLIKSIEVMGRTWKG
jgi:hypothetical protein